MEKITFCIPSKSNLRYLKTCIPSIRKNAFYADHDIIIFVDSDEDGTVDWLEEVKDEYNRLVMPSGLKVDEDFTISYSKLINVFVTVSPVKQVTNYEYEIDINENKRKIRILKPQYLSVVVTDLRNIMKYGYSSDYISQTNKSTYNPRITGV
jgi:glycosyltransferase involved in cell wall biosynthesis